MACAEAMHYFSFLSHQPVMAIGIEAKNLIVDVLNPRADMPDSIGASGDMMDTCECQRPSCLIGIGL